MSVHVALTATQVISNQVYASLRNWACPRLTQYATLAFLRSIPHNNLAHDIRVGRRSSLQLPTGIICA